ncbi:MAG TPA: sulfite exporter TauE/SafE family protein [Chitinophagaceae bacterium]|nr:sulfite exporter TauE/SafE family protein [Chitinophagaceae bacterium]
MKQRNMTTEIFIVILVGLAAGVLSGLVGVGGGIILVPAMVYFLHYTQHQAQGTSLGVLTFPVVILGFLKYYSDCKRMGTPIDFKIIGILAIGFLAGGFIGSSIALKIDKEALKKIFAIILFYTAFKMLNWDSIIIRWVKSLF